MKKKVKQFLGGCSVVFVAAIVIVAGLLMLEKTEKDGANQNRHSERSSSPEQALLKDLLKKPDADQQAFDPAASEPFLDGDQENDSLANIPAQEPRNTGETVMPVEVTLLSENPDALPGWKVLRREEIRNPDSAQNRQTISALREMRNARLNSE